MASIVSPQALALATAMAISGSVVLITLYKQKTLISSTSRILMVDHQNSNSNRKILRPCLSSVHFADDVVVRVVTDGETISSGTCSDNQDKDRGMSTEMHTNRSSLYQGILRDRVHGRIAYSC
ncbi:hypothetical protein MKW94_029917 [Papaver nudicaule]|uniref:Transmembrane protein n=1 Tax=Papaver nudicaule TaxID=74823 RepID=A0AA41SNI5_PAPNU|nr:hypothetical protein [Papaver nudicaule]